MGFLDKAKAMADQAMSSLDQTVSPEGENDRRGEQLFRDLGALTWAQHRGSATQATADEIQAVLEELAEVDPNRSLNVGRKHVHSGGTGAAPPPPRGQATHTASGVSTAPPPPGGPSAPPPPGPGTPPPPGYEAPQPAPEQGPGNNSDQQPQPSSSPTPPPPPPPPGF